MRVDVVFSRCVGGVEVIIFCYATLGCFAVCVMIYLLIYH